MICPLAAAASRALPAQQHLAEPLDEQGRTSELVPLWRRLYIEAQPENLPAPGQQATGSSRYELPLPQSF